MRDRVDLRETVFDFPKQGVITKDNVVIEINALIYFQITDAVKAVYEINNLPNAIEKLTTTLRNVIGELEPDECLTSRDTINMKLDDSGRGHQQVGVKVNRVELQDINPPTDIKEAMEKQMRAGNARVAPKSSTPKAPRRQPSLRRKAERAPTSTRRKARSKPASSRQKARRRRAWGGRGSGGGSDSSDCRCGGNFLGRSNPVPHCREVHRNDGPSAA